jgi:hypothetical protein
MPCNGLDNIIVGKTKERRGEERGELAKKATFAEQTAATCLEDPCRSTKQQLLITNIYMLTANKHRDKYSRVQRCRSSRVKKKRVIE